MPTSSITFHGHTYSLATVGECVGEATLTPRRTALALRDLFGLHASDEVALAVYDALLSEAPRGTDGPDVGASHPT